MKKLLSLGFLLIFLVNISVWAKSPKSSLVEIKVSTKKVHKKKSKKEKSSKSGKSGAEFKVESEINKSDVTFSFKDGQKKAKSKKAEGDSK